jgi:hypothetical protein
MNTFRRTVKFFVTFGLGQRYYPGL